MKTTLQALAVLTTILATSVAHAQHSQAVSPTAVKKKPTIATDTPPPTTLGTIIKLASLNGETAIKVQHAPSGSAPYPNATVVPFAITTSGAPCTLTFKDGVHTVTQSSGMNPYRAYFATPGTYTIEVTGIDAPNGPKACQGSAKISIHVAQP
ncbi:MAG: hypothetical protein JNM76_16990 [Betaproteobacteria bacterium]|nr:hypothetical protein [Betaproteobacteria bacterium]